jgi:predicted Zn-dependent protease
MRRRYAAGLFLAASLFSAAGGVAHAADAIAPGYQPRIDSDEAGLWLEADQIESALRQSPMLVRDQKLNEYVGLLVCSLAGPQYSAVRVLVVESPEVNAFCLPNGTMVVQTGLLLRMENEAQLAFVLGHELTHYLKRHGIVQHQTARTSDNVMVFLKVPLSILALLPDLAARGWVAAHGRDQEREADAGGFDAAVGLGYDSQQAAVIWANVQNEESANPKRSSPSRFLADHPTNKERLASMKQRAAELQNQGHADNLGAETFHSVTAPLRSTWLEQEIDRGEFSESIAVLQRLIKSDPRDGDLQYYLGESYRRRNDKGDNDRALAAYSVAIAATNAPVAVHRSFGLVALKSGQKAAARNAFRQYLALAPDASDRATIEYYLKTIGE